MAAFLVVVERLAETIEQMTTFHFAAFGFVGIGPEKDVGFGIE
jgi:hypothetical protein